MAANDTFVQVCCAWNAGNEPKSLVLIHHQKCTTWSLLILTITDIHSGMKHLKKNT